METEHKTGERRRLETCLSVPVPYQPRCLLGLSCPVYSTPLELPYQPHISRSISLGPPIFTNALVNSSSLSIQIFAAEF